MPRKPFGPIPYRLLVDAYRFPENQAWVIARSENEALETVERMGVPEILVLSATLGPGRGSGLAFLRAVLDQRRKREIKWPRGFRWFVSSNMANSDSREAFRLLMKVSPGGCLHKSVAGAAGGAVDPNKVVHTSERVPDNIRQHEALRPSGTDGS